MSLAPSKLRLHTMSPRTLLKAILAISLPLSALSIVNLLKVEKINGEGRSGLMVSKCVYENDYSCTLLREYNTGAAEIEPIYLSGHKHDRNFHVLCRVINEYPIRYVLAMTSERGKFEVITNTRRAVIASREVGHNALDWIEASYDDSNPECVGFILIRSYSYDRFTRCFATNVVSLPILGDHFLFSVHFSGDGLLADMYKYTQDLTVVSESKLIFTNITLPCENALIRQIRSTTLSEGTFIISLRCSVTGRPIYVVFNKEGEYNAFAPHLNMTLFDTFSELRSVLLQFQSTSMIHSFVKSTDTDIVLTLDHKLWKQDVGRSGGAELLRNLKRTSGSAVYDALRP